VDLAPTLLRAAGVEPGLTQDGTPLQPILDGDGERPPVLLEIYGRKDGDVFGVRTADNVYAEHANGFVELYDLRRDPYELDNVADAPEQALVRERLAGELKRLRKCSGTSCL
jgi:arylsulfatase A-like enzyme